jgi:hypothetical protein
MMRRRSFVCSLPFAVLACTKDPPSTTTTNEPLAPSAPVDPAFTGCAKSCGSRSAKDRADARAQPGAAPGDAVYCPVSGAVFRITDKTPLRESRGKTLYFCCDSCATWFSQHEVEVLAKRGLA